MPYKVCGKCKLENGVRAKKCSKCGTAFCSPVKAKNQDKEVKEELDWRTLQPGDRFKAVQGYGPYWQTKDGEKIGMGYTGKYIVISLDETGIRARIVSKHDSGTCYIYMGPVHRCPTTGMFKEPHKLIKLKVRNK